jgi:hypothetical protein
LLEGVGGVSESVVAREDVSKICDVGVVRRQRGGTRGFRVESPVLTGLTLAS